MNGITSALTVAQDAASPLQASQLYLDGKNDSQTTADPDTFNITAVTDVTIGRRGTNSDRAFPGTLDEVRIYDRVLTADEIKAMVGTSEGLQSVARRWGAGCRDPAVHLEATGDGLVARRLPGHGPEPRAGGTGGTRDR